MRSGDPYVHVIAVVAAAGAFAAGTWAFVFPASFFEVMAPYPPFSSHFVRDAGAGAIGISAVVMLALRWRDPLAVGLGGLTVGSVFHALSHLIDIDTRPGDFVGLTVFACVVTIGLVRRLRAGPGSATSDSRQTAR